MLSGASKTNYSESRELFSNSKPILFELIKTSIRETMKTRRGLGVAITLFCLLLAFLTVVDHMAIMFLGGYFDDFIKSTSILQQSKPLIKRTWFLATNPSNPTSQKYYIFASRIILLRTSRHKDEAVNKLHSL